MGWGFGHYHYHHKLSAHLHPNGVCPYGELKASIIKPYTDEKINLGMPYFYEDDPYFSLNLVSKALTADDSSGLDLTDKGTGGSFYVCSAGDSSKEKGLGKQLSFIYPKGILGIQNNTFFKTDNDELQLLCHNKKSAADNIECYAYISLEAVRSYMIKDGYFINFFDDGSGVWPFEVRKPSVKIIAPETGKTFNVGDEIEVQADIECVASARLIVGKRYPMGYIDGFEERRYNLENQPTVTFSKFKLTEDIVGSEAITSGSLSISISGHTGGIAIDAEIDVRTLGDAVEIRIESADKPDDKIYISAEQLEQLEWKDITKEMVNGLNVTLVKYDISTPERMRHFISQAMQESGLGIYTKEIASGEAYEGREDLGNTQSGDGPKYKGAGYIQMTGRSNYEAFSDYMKDPDIMEGVDYVARRAYYVLTLEVIK